MKRGVALAAVAIGAILIAILSWPAVAVAPIPTPTVQTTDDPSPRRSRLAAETAQPRRAEDRERRAIALRAAKAQLTCQVRLPNDTQIDVGVVQLWRGSHCYATGTVSRGVAEFSGLAPGPYRVAVVFPTPRRFIPTETVRVSVARHSQTIDLPVRRTGELVGRVRDPFRSRSWRVLAQRLDRLEFVDHSTHTTGSQLFELSELPPGRYAVKATAEDGETSTVPVVVAVTDHHDQPIWLEPTTDGQHLHGTLHDGDGAPLANQTIIAAPSDPDLRAGHIVPLAARLATARTDASGRFELKRLPERTISLHIDPRGGYRSPVREIPLSEGARPIRWRAVPRNRD